MYDFIKGTIAGKDPFHEEVVVETGGIGYRLSVSGRLLDQLPLEGEEVKIFAELVANEREMKLYGFSSADERSFFRLVCSNVRNVGPSTAIKILSAGAISDLVNAVLTDQTALFTAVKGVGRKMSERIVHELKDAVGKLNLTADISSTDTAAPAVPGNDARLDAIKALTALGFSEAAAVDRVNRALKAGGQDATVEELVKTALKLA